MQARKLDVSGFGAGNKQQQEHTDACAPLARLTKNLGILQSRHEPLVRVTSRAFHRDGLSLS
jgi:hypothetical protein